MRRTLSRRSLACLLAATLNACSEDLAPEQTTQPTRVGTSSFASTEPAEGLDASADGWSTESLGEMAKARLEEIFELEGSATAALLNPYCATDAQIHHLYPPAKEVIRDRDGFTVMRGKQSAPADARGPDALADALLALSAPFDSPPRIQLKTTAVSLSETNTGVTRVLYQAFGLSSSRPYQQSGDWQVTWGTLNNEILRIESLGYEELRGPEAGSPLFIEHTLGVFKGEEESAEQFLPSMSLLASVLDSASGPQINSFEGVAVGDVNGDGLEDVFFSQAKGLPNKLYLHKSDGTLRDVSRTTGIDMLAQTTASLIVDLDGDGDQDLITSGSSLMIFENSGNQDSDDAGPPAPRFVQRLELDITSTYSVSAVDYDLDRDLDLYICRYNDTQSTVPTPYHDAQNGPPNVLLRSDGPWSYTDATEESGLNHNNTRYSFAASWSDFDSDGDPDLYVANDFGRNNLYENRSGQFVDVSADLGVEDISAGMSADWGDPDSDGDYDIYIGNMYSAAGNRIAFQRRFRPEASEETLATLKRHARGNTLFLQGEGSFTVASVDAGVTMGRWSWCSRFLDIDNDSLEDLVVLNGNITSDDATHDL